MSELQPFSLWVPGIPAPQPRPRAAVQTFPQGPKCGYCGNSKTKSVVRMYSYPKRSRIGDWRAKVSEAVWEAARGRAIDEALQPYIWDRERSLRLTLTFHMPRPTQHWSAKEGVGIKPRYDGMQHTIKPDVDNLAKAVMDECCNRLYERDEQVVELVVRKLYESEPAATGVLIEAIPFHVKHD